MRTDSASDLAQTVNGFLLPGIRTTNGAARRRAKRLKSYKVLTVRHYDCMETRLSCTATSSVHFNPEKMIRQSADFNKNEYACCNTSHHTGATVCDVKTFFYGADPNPNGNLINYSTVSRRVHSDTLQKRQNSRQHCCRSHGMHRPTSNLRTSGTSTMKRFPTPVFSAHVFGIRHGEFRLMPSPIETRLRRVPLRSDPIRALHMPRSDVATRDLDRAAHEDAARRRSGRRASPGTPLGSRVRSGRVETRRTDSAAARLVRSSTARTCQGKCSRWRAARDAVNRCAYIRLVWRTSYVMHDLRASLPPSAFACVAREKLGCREEQTRAAETDAPGVPVSRASLASTKRCVQLAQSSNGRYT
jgi:hypothetical protein